MKSAKLIFRDFTPCFFAISTDFSLKALICGSAIFLAASYVIAPWQSHNLMFFKLIIDGCIYYLLLSKLYGRFFNSSRRSSVMFQRNGVENGVKNGVETGKPDGIKATNHIPRRGGSPAKETK